jgi:hypothetical protein
MFLFTDSQVKDEAFVEDINNLLNAGEVPNMFPQGERMQILEAVRPAAAKLGLESPLQLWGFFVAACRRNLHVVLCMSPIGDACRCVHMCVRACVSVCVCVCARVPAGHGGRMPRRGAVASPATHTHAHHHDVCCPFAAQGAPARQPLARQLLHHRLVWRAAA